MTEQEIAKLQEANEALAAENKKLKADNEALKGEVADGVKENTRLQGLLEKSQANEKQDRPTVTVDKKKYECHLIGNSTFDGKPINAGIICKDKELAGKLIALGVEYMVAV